MGAFEALKRRPEGNFHKFPPTHRNRQRRVESFPEPTAIRKVLHVPAERFKPFNCPIFTSASPPLTSHSRRPANDGVSRFKVAWRRCEGGSNYGHPRLDVEVIAVRL